MQNSLQYCNFCYFYNFNVLCVLTSFGTSDNQYSCSMFYIQCQFTHHFSQMDKDECDGSRTRTCLIFDLFTGNVCNFASLPVASFVRFFISSRYLVRRLKSCDTRVAFVCTLPPHMWRTSVVWADTTSRNSMGRHPLLSARACLRVSFNYHSSFILQNIHTLRVSLNLRPLI